MRFARPRSLLVLAPALLALAASSAAAQSAWQVGRPAPDLRLPTIDGGTTSLAELRGERVLLFEFASW